MGNPEDNVMDSSRRSEDVGGAGVGAPGGGEAVPQRQSENPEHSGLESKSTGGTQQATSSGATLLNEDIIRESLQSVVDPEIGFSIVDLGLVYEVRIDDEANVAIRMTLTSPACPVGPEILASAHMAALNTPGVKNVKVDLVWDPPWDPRVHATEDIKLEFGIL